MSAVYSERVLQWTTGGAWGGWGVPANYRFVLRWMAGSNSNAAAQVFQVVVAGVSVLRLSLTGAAGTLAVESYTVAYAGETIQAHIGAGPGAINLSGFLFHVPPGSGLELDQAVDMGPPAGYENDGSVRL